MASRYAILPRSSIEVVHLPFHRGYRCLCSVTAAHSIRRGMARPRPFRCLFQFRNPFLLSLASGGEERTCTTKHAAKVVHYGPCIFDGNHANGGDPPSDGGASS